MLRKIKAAKSAREIVAGPDLTASYRSELAEVITAAIKSSRAMLSYLNSPQVDNLTDEEFQNLSKKVVHNLRNHRATIAMCHELGLAADAGLSVLMEQAEELADRLGASVEAMQISISKDFQDFHLQCASALRAEVYRQ